MSGPVRSTDTLPDGPDSSADDTDSSATSTDSSADSTVELTPSKTALLGAQTIHRSLPTRLRRTVGAWCFLDHTPPSPGIGVAVGPHPHIGLQTVTWVLAGEVVHTDSIGSEQPIRPGELNLMTAGHGVAHAEQTYTAPADGVHLVQLWVAQPDATRHGAAAFEHHDAVPQLEVGRARARVLVGTFADVTSPARADTDHLGVDMILERGTTTLPVERHHEHAIVVVSGGVTVEGRAVGSDVLAHIGVGRDELTIVAADAARIFLLGGTPFEARPLMWWNFVARTHDEVDDAYRAWQAGDDRFGPVRSELEVIPAPTPPWLVSGEPFRRA